MGYVGLPTAIAFASRSRQVTGIDVSRERLRFASNPGAADLAGADRSRLRAAALAVGKLRLTADPAAIGESDAVIICVPTPVDTNHMPELSALHGACADVVAQARPGQTIILTSTTYVGTTAELLAEPLRRRGLVPGTDVFVAFSPERIDPGNPDHRHENTPRVVGGATTECAIRAAGIVSMLTPEVYLVSSPEAAEATKLYENIFRAVSLALANEFADACGVLNLDPIEVTLAAATKPYGFLAAFPGPGVGGHCIPCDPHYLLWQLGSRGHSAPLIEQAMRSIRLRPERVVERAAEVLAAAGQDLAGARVLVAGASYKPGVRDLRESSAVPMIESLLRKSADVHYFDPLVPSLTLPGGAVLTSETSPWHRLGPGRSAHDASWRGLLLRRRGAASWTRRTSTTTRPSGPWCEAIAMTAISASRPGAVATTFRPDVSTPAVLLKLDPNVMHHGGLGAIRSLGRMGVPVYAVQESAFAPAGHSRYLRGKGLWQPGRLTPDRGRAGLLRLAELIGRPSVLIPTDDAGAIFLAEHADGLRGRFLFAEPPALLPRQLAGKHSLHRLCDEVGFPTPRSAVPRRRCQRPAGSPPTTATRSSASWPGRGSPPPVSTAPRSSATRPRSPPPGGQARPARPG